MISAYDYVMFKAGYTCWIVHKNGTYIKMICYFCPQYYRPTGCPKVMMYRFEVHDKIMLFVMMILRHDLAQTNAIRWLIRSWKNIS